MVVKYLEDHPADLHLPDAILTLQALAQAYPCKK
jgi:hypothetical protein